MKLIWAILAAFLIGFIAYQVLFKDFFAIDSCLDGGGCWDYADRVCRVNEPNAQELCDRANPHRK